MSRSSRRSAAEGELLLKEAAFRDALIVALQACAGGRWGLFGQNDAALKNVGRNADHYESNDARELLGRADEIANLRSKLGFAETSPLVKRFLAYRAMRGSTVLGEPKLATRFLEEIEKT